MLYGQWGMLLYKELQNYSTQIVSWRALEGSCIAKPVCGALQRTNIETSKQIFTEEELRGPSPISTFICLLGIYIFPWKICQFCCRKYVNRSWEYINRSQTHECGNWDWGRAIPRKEIHKWDFLCSVGLERRVAGNDHNVLGCEHKKYCWATCLSSI